RNAPEALYSPVKHQLSHGSLPKYPVCSDATKNIYALIDSIITPVIRRPYGAECTEVVNSSTPANKAPTLHCTQHNSLPTRVFLRLIPGAQAAAVIAGSTSDLQSIGLKASGRNLGASGQRALTPRDNSGLPTITPLTILLSYP
ncbi:unnamed protein product, partial [Calicophoron daubneyi]